jgi:pimeloyl-ACP methyl ester carboxylesterase
LSVEKSTKETVVLVHGLWMRGWVMTLLGLRLQRCGFHTVVFSYPSMNNSLSQNALLLSNFVAGITASRIHFIGHSLGGLLIMKMLAECPDPRAGRIVLVGSPCHASYAANKLARMGLGRYLIGRGMLQCLKQKVPECADWYEVGSIAGCKSLGLGRLLGGLPSPNDGVVAVEETRISGTRDQIVLNESHSSMLISAGVARQVCMFLQYGYFFHNPE